MGHRAKSRKQESIHKQKAWKCHKFIPRNKCNQKDPFLTVTECIVIDNRCVCVSRMKVTGNNGVHGAAMFVV